LYTTKKSKFRNFVRQSFQWAMSSLNRVLPSAKN
jgi:hypothetical protein